MILVALLALTVSSVLGQRFGDIDLCTKKWVKPGDFFDIGCGSDIAVAIKLFMPHEELPPPEFEAILTEDSFRTIKREFSYYADANKEDHEGFYTCVVQHGPGLPQGLTSSAECEVIIVDICEELSDCGPTDTCIPNYDDGTWECQCDVEQRMRVREQDVIQTVEMGQQVSLNAGITTYGTPRASVIWEHLEEGGSYKTLSETGGTLTLQINDGAQSGEYVATIRQCNREYVSYFNLEMEMEPTPTVPPTVPPTFGEVNARTQMPTCTIFPSGVVEQFDDSANFYDFACSHVLVADLDAENGYQNPYYVYGTFDNFQGKDSLQSMTFYIGSAMFEVQRGWFVNINGAKWPLNAQGEAKQVPGTECTITFDEWHVIVDCPQFMAFYDGIMAGHVSLKNIATDPKQNLQFGASQVGLCFGSYSRTRSNWQVGYTGGKCSIDTGADACSAQDAPGCTGYDVTLNRLWKWGSCGNGATMSCNELQCDGDRMTAMQECSLNLAYEFGCALRSGTEGPDSVEACPRSECDWFLDVVAQGCPQKDLPFSC